MSKQKQLKWEETNAAALLLAGVMGKGLTAISSLTSTLLKNQRERLNAQEAKEQNTHAKITHIRVQLLPTCQESILFHQ